MENINFFCMFNINNPTLARSGGIMTQHVAAAVEFKVKVTSICFRLEKEFHTAVLAYTIL